MSDTEPNGDGFDERFEKLRADFDRYMTFERQFNKDSIEHIAREMRLTIRERLEDSKEVLQKRFLRWVGPLSVAVLGLWGFTNFYQISEKARSVWDEKVGAEVISQAKENIDRIRTNRDNSEHILGDIGRTRDNVLVLQKEIAGATVPIGTILPWWGDPKGPLPPGFELCDGSPPVTTDSFKFRKPNLEGKFLKGAGRTFNAEVAVAKGDEFTVGANTLGHALAVDEIPDHWHEIVLGKNAGVGTNPLQATDRATTGNVGEPNGKTQPFRDSKRPPKHDWSTERGKPHFHEIPPLKIDPPHYEVVFIIRVR